ncbi:hypothetical protein DSM101010T_00160 [Desulfovibrio subterraneus]|uniref:Uncharacterized protein n=1 Tax=Desulfovibrio subterraneus TaxID=2718620 RepID=A0A7J0BEP6_9BACT|nr:hypothetical protein DSM101010T_00160 [Desulfovibrio subterraneus]
MPGVSCPGVWRFSDTFAVDSGEAARRSFLHAASLHPAATPAVLILCAAAETLPGTGRESVADLEKIWGGSGAEQVQTSCTPFGQSYRLHRLPVRAE